jgi:hypothetical protein
MFESLIGDSSQQQEFIKCVTLFVKPFVGGETELPAQWQICLVTKRKFGCVVGG